MGADEAFAIIRAILFLARHLDLMRKYPDQIGPNVKANVEEGLVRPCLRGDARRPPGDIAAGGDATRMACRSGCRS
jgi:hypothetical protein